MMSNYDQRYTSKSIDEWEEEAMDEIMMMSWAEIIESGHQWDKYLAELLLTVGSNTSVLEEIQ